MERVRRVAIVSGAAGPPHPAVLLVRPHPRDFAMPSDQSTRLGHARVASLLLNFSAPAIVGMMAQALYYFIDRIFVGRAVGADGLAGMVVALPPMLVILAISMLIGFGAGSLISIRLGQQRKDEAELVLANAMLLLMVLSALLTGLGVAFLGPILRLSGASPTVLPFAHDYLQVIVLGAVFQVVGFGLNAIIRGEGNPKIAMATLLIGVLLNVILAPIFLFWFGWGMRGAGLATVSAQAVSALWTCAYFFGGRSLLRMRLNLRLDWAICAQIVAVGSPPFAMQLAASVMNSLLNHQLRLYGGDLAMSALGIIYTISMLIVMPVFGINQGAQPIIGYNYGALQFQRVRHALLLAILAASSLTVAGFCVSMLFPSQIIRLFAPDDPDLIELGSHAMRICQLMLPLVGFQVLGANYFQAVGKPKHAMLLSLSRQVLILIPAVMILPRWLGLNGVWIAIPMADFVSSALTGVWLARELRHLDRRHRQAGLTPEEVILLAEEPPSTPF